MRFKFRFTAFVLAMGLMVALIVSAAIISWRHTSKMRSGLHQVQSESLQIGEQFRHSVWELSDSLVRYRTSHEPGDWERFNKSATELDTWIDDQKPKLNTDREKKTMELIDVAFDRYQAAAREIHEKVEANPQQSARVGEFPSVRLERENLTTLGLELAEAHRERTTQLLGTVNDSIARMGVLLLGALTLLLIFGGGLGLMVYRDVIAPLRVKLVESLASVERSEKLASLGVLAAGVAHEIRNPLTAIKAALFLQLKKAEPGSQDRADLELVGREITRLDNIVRDFLQFARPAEPRLVTIPNDQPLRDVQKLLAPQLAKADIRLVVEDSPPVPIKIDPEQIQQVLINLIQNASDSIGQRGTITLRTRAATKPLAGRNAEVAILEVADTGQGIAPEAEQRLFDPFFSTKSAGTGLGLSIAARIVEKHGGTLEYQTQLNHGTIFGIILPRANA